MLFWMWNCGLRVQFDLEIIRSFCIRESSVLDLFRTCVYDQSWLDCSLATFSSCVITSISTNCSQTSIYWGVRLNSQEGQFCCNTAEDYLELWLIDWVWYYSVFVLILGLWCLMISRVSEMVISFRIGESWVIYLFRRKYTIFDLMGLATVVTDCSLSSSWICGICMVSVVSISCSLYYFIEISDRICKKMQFLLYEFGFQ